MISTGRFKNIALFALMLMLNAFVFGQENGQIKGKVSEAGSGEPLIGATVFIVGTYIGTVVNIDGEYTLNNVKPGDYSIKFSFIGFGDKIFNGVEVSAGKTKILDVSLEPRAQSLEAVTIVGEKSLVNLESASTSVTISREDLQDMNARDVQEVVAMQAGVSKTPDGLQIRGARVYETSFLIDGVNAQDPLAGTGFGVDVASSAIQDIQIVTGGMGAEFGDGSAGVISTVIREGGDKFEIGGSWQRDNLGINPNTGSSWNTDIFEIRFSGSVPKTNKKLKYFNSFNMNITDDYFGNTANQLHSSILAQNGEASGMFPDSWQNRINDGSFWAMRYNNSYSHTFKLSYDIKPGTKIFLTNQHSLKINQNTRTLQIVGFDAILAPGYQYRRELNLDNATTYTHHSNLSVLGFSHFINNKFSVNASVSRLFTNLRADANGRPFREETVDQIYDEQSIITNPIEVYNPGEDVVFLMPGPWLINNGGISPVWHDHYVEEYSFKTTFKYYHSNSHELSFGQEHRQQEFQWVDVARPWVGAPIKINDSLSTPSISVGSSSDVWAVRPNQGGIFFTDKITYKGIIASIGARLNYWAPGKFADDAVANPNAPVVDQIREDYLNETTNILGLRYKFRFLPKINVSFPVTENNVLFFNYGHSMRLPHPRFLYAGLDPAYQANSFLSELGNPNLNPEVNVSYEIGLKSQITKDIGITFTAFNNNRFDYIVSRNVIVRDVTGRPVTKTMFINQDYAKVMGVEFGTYVRFAKHFRGFYNLTYQIARGKSNSARESGLQIEQTGEIALSTEQYLAWDRPWDLNLGLIFSPDTSLRIWGIPMKYFKAFVSTSFTSGFRYTPVEQQGVDDNNRPVYAARNDLFLQESAIPWFNTDFKLSREIPFKKGSKSGAILSFEVRNVFNNQNAQIINAVTGRGWEPGDPVTNNFRDPRFTGPFERGALPGNPARYLAPRQFLFGIEFKF